MCRVRGNGDVGVWDTYDLVAWVYNTKKSSFFFSSSFLHLSYIPSCNTHLLSPSSWFQVLPIWASEVIANERAIDLVGRGCTIRLLHFPLLFLRRNSLPPSPHLSAGMSAAARRRHYQERRATMCRHSLTKEPTYPRQRLRTRHSAKMQSPEICGCLGEATRMSQVQRTPFGAAC